MPSRAPARRASGPVSRPPITTLEDLLASTEPIHPTILTKRHDAFTAIVDIAAGPLFPEALAKYK